MVQDGTGLGAFNYCTPTIYYDYLGDLKSLYKNGAGGQIAAVWDNVKPDANGIGFYYYNPGENG